MLKSTTEMRTILMLVLKINLKIMLKMPKPKTKIQHLTQALNLMILHLVPTLAQNPTLDLNQVRAHPALNLPDNHPTKLRMVNHKHNKIHLVLNNNKIKTVLNNNNNKMDHNKTNHRHNSNQKVKHKILKPNTWKVDITMLITMMDITMMDITMITRMAVNIKTEDKHNMLHLQTATL